MRPGRVNTYHNDPFVAAAANNAFVIALFLPPRCSSYRVISQSLFHPCVYLPLPHAYFRPIYGDKPVSFGRFGDFPSLRGTRRNKIESNVQRDFKICSCITFVWYELNMEKLPYWKDVCGNFKGINNRKCRGTYASFHLIGRSRWIANETGGSIHLVEGRGTMRSWNLYSNIIMEVGRIRRTKNKIETGRPLFPRPWILVKISRTRRGGGGGPPSKTFTYDRFGGPLDHPLVSNWRFLRV